MVSKDNLVFKYYLPITSHNDSSTFLTHKDFTNKNFVLFLFSEKIRNMPKKKNK